MAVTPGGASVGVGTGPGLCVSPDPCADPSPDPCVDTGSCPDTSPGFCADASPCVFEEIIAELGVLPVAVALPHTDGTLRVTEAAEAVAVAAVMGAAVVGGVGVLVVVASSLSLSSLR